MLANIQAMATKRPHGVTGTAVAGRRHRHHREPHAIGNAMGGTLVEVGLAPFQEPDQGADNQQKAEQRADGYEHLGGESASEGPEHAALRVRAHRDAEAGGEIGMGG
jgi:hypothetical protein